MIYEFNCASMTSGLNNASMWLVSIKNQFIHYFKLLSILIHMGLQFYGINPLIIKKCSPLVAVFFSFLFLLNNILVIRQFVSALLNT